MSAAWKDAKGPMSKTYLAMMLIVLVGLFIFSSHQHCWLKGTSAVAQEESPRAEEEAARRAAEQRRRWGELRKARELRVRYEEGVALYNQGKFEEARQAFREVLTGKEKEGISLGTMTEHNLEAYLKEIDERLAREEKGKKPGIAAEKRPFADVKFYRTQKEGFFSLEIDLSQRLVRGQSIGQAALRSQDDKTYAIYPRKISVVEETALRLMLEGRDESYRISRCQNNLKRIGQALQVYASDYGGYFPPPEAGLISLHPEYLRYEGHFRCPGDPDFKFPENISYDYWDEQRKVSERADVPLAWDKKGNHLHGRMALYCDGHTEWERFLTLEEERRKASLLNFSGRFQKGGKARFLLSYTVISKPLRHGMKEIARFAQGSSETGGIEEILPLAEGFIAPAVRELVGFRSRYEKKEEETIELELPVESGGDEAVRKKWARAQAEHFAQILTANPEDSFYQYALLQSGKKYGIAVPEVEALEQRMRRFGERRPDLYSIFTGGAAIQETLQLDALGNQRTKDFWKSEDISTLKAPEIKSHPFKKMLGEKESPYFDMAGLVPFDNYYIHFTSITKEMEFAELLEDWGTNFLEACQVSARGSKLREKLQGQICIQESALARLFGELVIKDIALTGGDPFLKQGSDLAVIINVLQPAAFELEMTKSLFEAKAGNDDAALEKIPYGGLEITALTNPDRCISSYSTYLGNFKVYSNSLPAIKRIIDTSQGKRKSLAQSLDFLYMRTIFPGREDAEAGFIYLSDPFIRRLVGPELKIKQRRRTICENNLRLITNATQFYRLENRAEPPSLQELIQEKYIDQALLICPDGGAYSLDELKRPVCSVHNRLRYLSPNLELAVDKITKEEKNEYSRFVERYNDYWRTYFDPIGIRISLSPEKISLETCILPLIENSIYNGLKEVTAGASISLDKVIKPEETIISVGASINRGLLAKAELISHAFKQELGFEADEEPLKWLGLGVSMNLYDADLPVGLVPQEIPVQGLRRMPPRALLIMPTVCSFIFPTYLTIDVADESEARLFIIRVKNYLKQKMMRGARGEAELEFYQLSDYKGYKIEVITFRAFVVKPRFFYAFIGDKLYISSRKFVLTDIIDRAERVKAGEIPLASEEKEGNLILSINRRAFKKIASDILLYWEERARAACHKNLLPIHTLLTINKAEQADLDRVAEKFYGANLFCPDGGRYLYDKKADLVFCSIHGTRAHHRQLIQMPKEAKFMRFLDSLKEINICLRFTPEGLKTTVEMKRGKEQGR